MIPDHSPYVGKELELFEHAKNWKTYFSKKISPHLRGNVLEVGAGNGINTSFLIHSNSTIQSWTCLEPDLELMNQAHSRDLTLVTGPRVETIHGTISNLDKNRLYDSILYLDVLEHIEDDAGELTQVCESLAKSGTLILLCPAHQHLFSLFDASIGHFRRYNSKLLEAAVPKTLDKVFLGYMDSVGYLASLANRLLLKQSLPSSSQIQIWDRLMVPLSKAIDPLLGYQFGKSILGIWKKPK
jgi:protein-L-isoaspartate O-methyltransferase